ncbi:MFS transporter [Actinospica sp. MGRD01-02]|uniref:MFS transporter n=1 Tax=Actinospica acidithermotolerans TaxID=2828514 RepID=A0A941EKS5_9ACTN|nr:MFS transporter [Actinospica acidithermotolerans]MBR7829399.1 MFS transporter [Actinospica acidithermotolerans]
MLENTASRELAAGDSIGGRQLRVLWSAYAISSLGSAVSMGAIPLIAVLRLGESAGAVSLMTAFAFAATAVIALPLAPFVEQQPKQRVLRVTEALSFAALCSVIAAFAVGGLSYVQLCVVLMVVTVCSILYNSALTSLLKQAIAEHRQLGVNARLSTVDWTTSTVGPAIGGLLITVVGVVSSTTVDALSFAVAAVLLSSRFVGGQGAVETPASADGAPREKLLRRVAAGLRHTFAHRTLRGLYINAMVFAGAIRMTSPLLAVLMLDDLHLSAFEYGIALGAPCAAGLLGSVVAQRVTRRFGTHRVLAVVGALRGPCLLPLAFAPVGIPGLLTIVGAESLLLFLAGVFNPVMTSYRMRETPADLITRLATAWSASNKSITPLFIALGGWLATLLGVRDALLIAGVICLLSGIFLPWRHAD